MKRVKYLPLIFLLSAITAFPATLDAQYQIRKSVFGNGGGVANGSDFQLKGTLGETIAGNRSESSLQLLSGFWNRLSGNITAIEPVENFQPKIFQLLQNFPNPFNPTTQIGFHLPRRAAVLIEIFDILGRRMDVAVRKNYPAGIHTISFNGEGLPSGVYFYRLTARENAIRGQQLFTQIRRMILLK